MAEQSASEMIRRMLVVSLGVEGAEEVIRALGGVDSAVEQVQRQSTKATRVLSGLGKSFVNTSKFIAAAGAGVSSFSLAMRQLGLTGARDELFQYNKQLIASRTIFARLGEGVQQTERRILELRNKFAFTREEVLQLQKQVQLGFNTITVEQMGDYMQLLADAVGESADEMMRLDSVLQSVAGKMPIFQELLKGPRSGLESVGRDMLEAAVLLGDIDVATFKEASGFITAQQNRRLAGTGDSGTIRGMDRDREDTARGQMRAIRQLNVTQDELKIAVAERMMPVVETVADFAEKNFNELVRIGSLMGVLATAASISGGFGAAKGAFGLLGGTTSGGLVGRLLMGKAAATGGGAAAGGGVAAGGGAIAAGSAMGAALITAAAVGGLTVGEKIGQHIDWSGNGSLGEAINDLENAMDKQLAKSIEIASNQYKNLEGGNDLIARAKEIADLEAQIFAKQKENLGGPLDSIMNVWSDPVERANKEADDLTKRLNDLRSIQSRDARNAKQQAITVEDLQNKETERAKQAERNATLQKIIRESIEVQSNLLNAIVSKYETTLDLLSKFGGANPFGNDIGAEFGDVIGQTTRLIDAQGIAVSNIDSAIATIRDTGSADGYKDILNTLMQARENGVAISDEVFEALRNQVAPLETISRLETERLRLQNAQRQEFAKISDSLNDVTRAREGELRRASAMSSLMATQVSLADNLAMGVGASAQMRFEQVDALQREIEIMREQQSMLMQREQQVAEELRARGASEEEVRAAIYQAQTQRLEIEDKILQKQQQQASVTRTIRDGWVSAISAMMTGEGMFTKIVVDQNKRIGTMMSATQNATTGLRTGFAGRGFTESQKYTVGGISGSNDGVTDAWGNAMTNSNPLSGFNGGTSAADVAEAWSTWQESIGRNMSTGAAGAGGARYGTSELLERINDSVQRPVILQTEGPPLPVQVTNAAHKIEISVTPQDMKTMVAELIKQFTMVMKTVTEAAQDRVMDEMNTRR